MLFPPTPFLVFSTHCSIPLSSLVLFVGLLFSCDLKAPNPCFTSLYFQNSTCFLLNFTCVDLFGDKWRTLRLDFLSSSLEGRWGCLWSWFSYLSALYQPVDLKVMPTLFFSLILISLNIKLRNNSTLTISLFLWNIQNENVQVREYAARVSRK